MSRLEKLSLGPAPALLVLALALPGPAVASSATSELSAREGGALMGFELESTAFADGAAIPKKHTCDGPDLSPPLAWSGVPPGTKSFALICDDPDAPEGKWVLWVIYDLASRL